MVWSPSVRRRRRGVVTLTAGSWPVHKPIPGAGGKRDSSVRLAIKVRTDALAGVPLFAGLSKRQLHAVARECESRRWPSGFCIVPEETKAQVCYIIVEGRADVCRHGRIVAQLGPGDFFGEIALLD